MSEAKCVTILKQICNGYRQLNKIGIMHLNLTPNTIKYHNGIAKISDFWYSQTHNPNIYNSKKEVYIT